MQKVKDNRLLDSREAAEYLHVCARTLHSLTAPRGPIKAVRIGRALRYRREVLDEFCRRQELLVA